jgi:hypothetical protein
MATISNVEEAKMIISNYRATKGKTRANSFDTFTTIKGFITSRWGNNERILNVYSIEYLKSFMDTGLIKRLMFKVTQINDNKNVKVEVVTYNLNTATNDPDINAYYFVFENQFLSRTVDSEIDPNGFDSYSEKANPLDIVSSKANAVAIRLGEISNAGEVVKPVLILNTAFAKKVKDIMESSDVKIFDGSGGTGGEPAGAGGRL